MFLLQIGSPIFDENFTSDDLFEHEQQALVEEIKDKVKKAYAKN